MLQERLHYRNIFFKIGRGQEGWPEFAPYDRIIVTAAPAEFPEPLFDQLAEGGIAVAPVGTDSQRLVRYQKRQGRIHAADTDRRDLRPPGMKKLLIFLLAFAGLLGAENRFITIFVQDKPFSAEIADTPEKHARGLMYRRRLKADYGMLFIFAEEDIRSFWMKNTLIPLDIIFLNSEQADRRHVLLRPPLPRRSLPQLHLGAAGPLRPGNRRRHGQKAEIANRR